MELSMNSHNKITSKLNEDTNSNENNRNLRTRTKRGPPKGYVYTHLRTQTNWNKTNFPLNQSNS
uniref:Uncharacterized protein n=1 Tax=Haemonchus contortus TaxID=6289 RepID=A0A7I5ECZ4_HAECO